LVKIQKSLDNITTSSEEEQIGIKIIKAAIEYPAKQIANNA
jgi:chaperonin GroEL (HSP60 family)